MPQTKTVAESHRPGFEPGELSFRAFQVFVALVETGSVNETARRLGLSPSTVSQQITNFEALAGTRLFDRSARPIVPTIAGAILRPHAYRILEAIGEARSDLIRLNLSSLTELRLGVIDDLDASVAPDMVRHLRDSYPGCLFPAVSRRSDELTRMLEARDLDIIVSGLGPEDPTVYEAWPILREGFILVSAKGVFPDNPTQADLKRLPFVRYNRSMPLGRRIAQHLARLRITLDENYAFDASRSVFATVSAIGGWAITTPLGVLDAERFWPALDIRPLPFTGFNRSIRLYARHGETGTLPSELAEMCRDLVRSRLQSRLTELLPFADQVFEIVDSEASTS